LSSFLSTGNQLQTCRVLLTAGADDVLIDQPDMLTIFNGPLSTLRYLQQQMYPPFSALPEDFRLRLATEYLNHYAWWHNQAWLAEAILIPISGAHAPIMSLATEDGRNFFRALIGFWARYRRDITERWSSEPGSSAENLDTSLDDGILDQLKLTAHQNWPLIGLRALICKIVSAGFLAQITSSSGQTPLAEILLTISRKKIFIESPKLKICKTIAWVEMIMMDWLEILSDCGIELEAYGRWETIHFQDKDKDLDLVWHEKRISSSNVWVLPFCARRGLRFVGFTFGPRLQDWDFGFSEPSDEFAGEFWLMIEEGRTWNTVNEGSGFRQTIPGAWSHDF
jgi:hypothetical protein